MEDERRRDIGLFRYSLVREPADAGLSGAERGEVVRELAGVDHVGPDGTRVRVGRSTLDRWIRAWRAGGFEALVPAARQGVWRTPAEVLAAGEALKREVPARTAAQVAAIMAISGGEVCSRRTLQRHFARVGLNIRPDGTPPRVFGRFEASVRNELWTGDAMHGPMVGGRKTYLLAFIDDFSRTLAAYRWTWAEDTVRLSAAFRSGVAARGVPQAVLVDRGSAFVDAQFARACAVLGVRLIHARPRSPTTKGKIERFFRTARSQFVVEVEHRGVADLAELNTLFTAWVEVVYHRRVHTETRAAPLERFGMVPPPVLPSPALLREAFLWSAKRRVTKTASISLFGNSFEVDSALVGRVAELIFDPFDLTDIEVRFEGRSMGKAVAVHIRRHTHPKARPDAAPTPVPTGIDYLSLLAARRDAELAGRRIDYANLDADNLDAGLGIDHPDGDHHDHNGDDDCDDDDCDGHGGEGRG
jgi:putative transposase